MRNLFTRRRFLGDKLTWNTYIGNMSSQITNETQLAVKMVGVSASDIFDFEIVGTDLRFNVYKPYSINQMQSKPMTYYIDLDNWATEVGYVDLRQNYNALYYKLDGVTTMVTGLNFQSGAAYYVSVRGMVNFIKGREFYRTSSYMRIVDCFSATALGNQTFYSHSETTLLERIYLPKVTFTSTNTFGSMEGSGAKVCYIEPTMMLDGNYINLQNRGWQLRAVTNYDTPNKVTDLSVSTQFTSNNPLNWYKDDNSTNWNSGFSSVEKISGDGYYESEILESGISADNRMMGISVNDINGSYTHIEFAIFFIGTLSDTVRIYESGVNKGDKETFAIGDKFKIERIGAQIVYKKNDVIFYTSLVVPSVSDYVVDTTLRTVNAGIYNSKIDGVNITVTGIIGPVTNANKSNFFLDFTPPIAGTNANDYYELWKEYGEFGLFMPYDETFVSGGQSFEIGKKIKIKTVDYLFNKSEFSNVVTIDTDSDADLFSTNANITEPSEQSAINNLVVSLKRYSLWDKMQAIYPFVGEAEPQHKLNLKDPRDTDEAFRIAFAGTWVHSTNGSKPSSSTSEGNTFFIPSTHGTHGDSGLTNAFYDTNTENGSALGTRDGSSNSFSLLQRNDLVGGRMYDIQGRFEDPGTNDARGVVTNTLTGTEQTVYKNGVDLDSKPTAGGTMPITAVAINMNGITGGTKTHCFSAIHKGLDAIEVANLHTIIDDFNTALGRKTW